MTTPSAAGRRILYVYKGGAFAEDADHFKVGMATAHIDADSDLTSPEIKEAFHRAADSRVRDQNRTASGLSAAYEIVFVAPFVANDKSYTDHDVHEELKRLGHFPVKNDANAREWFHAPLSSVKEAAHTFLDQRYFIAHTGAYTDERAGEEVAATERDRISFRPEQQDAINRLRDARQHGSSALLDAVPRFGKTVTAYGFVRESEARTVLVLTNRPAVKQGWGDDKQLVLGDDYRFVTKNNIPGVVTCRPGDIDFETEHVVSFVSIQDAKGEGGLKAANQFMFDVHWDIVIIDEAHEGTQTELMESVARQIDRDFTLWVTGTSHNLIENAEAKYDTIVSWSYEDEQAAKTQWSFERPDEPNPYALLPKLSLKTIDIFQDLNAIQKYGTDEDAAFRFMEFFAVENGVFKHRDDVVAFLENLARPETPYMPYARGQHPHALWCLPSVDSCQAMQALLAELIDYRGYTALTVAGEQSSGSNALSDVLAAIGDEPWKTKTITLTVGRLTVGVSIPGWDAVLMMSNTSSPISYTQSIFRGKTPCKNFSIDEDGNVLPKLTAHVYDFAPDRALSLVIQLSGASVSDSNSMHRVQEMLNYMSVVSYGSNTMRDYDVARLNHTIRHLQARNVVSSGFSSDALINRSMLADLGERDFERLTVLKGIASVTSKRDKKAIEIAANHYDNPNYQNTEALTRAAKKKDDAGGGKSGEQRELDERRKAAFAIKNQLLAVAARLPLLTIAQREYVRGQFTFAGLIETFDDASWEEFMPKTDTGAAISKRAVINLERYFNMDTLDAAMNELVLQLDAAYELGASKGAKQQNKKLREIWSYIKNPDKETVISRYDVADRLLDAALPLDSSAYIDSTFIDIGCKSGIMLLAAADRLIDAHVGESVPYDDIVSKQLFSNSNSKAGKLLACSILGINADDPAFDNHTHIRVDRLMDSIAGAHPSMADDEISDIAGRVLTYANLGFMRTYPSAWGHAKQICERIHQIAHDERKWAKALAKRGRLYDMVKKVDAIVTDTDVVFDYCISNPPYQRTIATSSNKAQQVWQSFVDIGRSLARRSVMIHPSRFLANTAKEGGQWAEKTIKDPTFKVVKVFADAKEVFPQGVDIKGGVAITDFLHGRTSGGYASSVYVDNPIVAGIAEKTSGHRSLMDIVSSESPFKSDIRGRFRKDGKSAEFKTNAFEWSQDLHELEGSLPLDKQVTIWGSLNGRRQARYTSIDHFDTNSQKKLRAWNVLLPKANGSGAMGEALSALIIAGPMVGCTQTFLTVGDFETAAEAGRCAAYLKTKFARACLGILKRTQDTAKNTWRCVPLPDFGKDSDIDWDDATPNIDKHLYEKYGLDSEEIAFIEANVQEMP